MEKGQLHFGLVNSSRKDVGASQVCSEMAEEADDEDEESRISPFCPSQGLISRLLVGLPVVLNISANLPELRDIKAEF